MQRTGSFLMAVALTALAAGLFAAEPVTPPPEEAVRDYVPQPGTFPPLGAGIDLAGELIAYDPVTRTGRLRRDGDFVDRDVVFRFALLPYAEVYYHGSPAELQDVPPGTRLRGRFLLPPEGDTKIPPPAATDKTTPRHSHALILEDDFSHAARRGEAWKVTAIDLAELGKSLKQRGVLSVESTVAGPDGKPESMQLDVSRATRLWQRDGGLVELETVAPGQVIQMNLGWAPDWKNGRFHCLDIWLDEESQQAFSERQRRVHARKMTYFWPAAWIDHVEHQPRGSGILTLTLFGGIDEAVEDALRWMVGRNVPVLVAAADASLTTWWQDHDKAAGPLLEIRDIANPPLGHSGLQIRVQLQGPLLEGFRPGRFVRVKPHVYWPNGVTPPGERRSKWDPLAADAGFLLDERPDSPAAAQSAKQVTGEGGE